MGAIEGDSPSEVFQQSGASGVTRQFNLVMAIWRGAISDVLYIIGCLGYRPYCMWDFSSIG